MSLQVQRNSDGSAATLSYADTEPDGVAALSDPATKMLALILLSRGAQSEASQEDIQRASRIVEETRRQVTEAMQRASEAAEHSGFFGKLSEMFSGDIGALCELVVSAAVIAATGGVGAAGVLAIAATTLSLSSDVAKHAGASPAVCATLSGMGALAGLAVGDVGGLSAAWQAVATTATTVGALANAGGTGAAVASSEWHATAMDRQTDATAARGQQSVALFDYDLALEELERSTRDTSRAASTASNIVQSENDGRMSLIARLGAA